MAHQHHTCQAYQTYINHIFKASGSLHNNGLSITNIKTMFYNQTSLTNGNLPNFISIKSKLSGTGYQYCFGGFDFSTQFPGKDYENTYDPDPNTDSAWTVRVKQS